MNHIKRIIRNRPVFILAHGSSVQDLEDRIQEFKDYDICWTASGNFPIFEKYMLSKIGKQLDYIFDVASVPDSRRAIYEPVRQKRIQEYLARNTDNLWVTTHGMIRDTLNEILPAKCELIDRAFPPKQIGHYMGVPNSVTLHIASAIWGGASKIFLFGVDGTHSASHLVYYKPEECEKERLIALGSNIDQGLIRDTDNFQVRFPIIWEEYKALFQKSPDIFNCTDKKFYKMIPRVNLDDVKRLL